MKSLDTEYTTLKARLDKIAKFKTIEAEIASVLKKAGLSSFKRYLKELAKLGGTAAPAAPATSAKKKGKKAKGAKIKRPRITDATRRKFDAMLKKNKSYAEIAVATGTSATSVMMHKRNKSKK